MIKLLSNSTVKNRSIKNNDQYSTAKNHLRDVVADDLVRFYEHQLDPEANYMAAFTAKNPSDKEAFLLKWDKILGDNKTINQTILLDNTVVGHIAQFEQFGHPEVTYWIEKSHWGKGIATAALEIFLRIVTLRPLYARAVKDNIGSLRVLEKCGFVITGEDKGFANARQQEVEEYILMLK